MCHQISHEINEIKNHEFIHSLHQMGSCGCPDNPSGAIESDMKLKDWLFKQHVNMAEFARRLNKPPQTVARYVKDTRIPGRKVMADIGRLTAGEVRANDFYDMAQPDGETESADEQEHA